MKNIIPLLLCTALLIPHAVAANDDDAAIRSVVQKYFDGTSQGKPKLVTEAFLPSLKVEGVKDDGGVWSVTGQDYISHIEPGVLVERVARIESLDFTDKVASVKATIKWNKETFTDYLLLLKVDGNWTISNKIATWQAD